MLCYPAKAKKKNYLWDIVVETIFFVLLQLNKNKNNNQVHGRYKKCLVDLESK